MNHLLNSAPSQQERQRAPRRLKYPDFTDGQALQVVNNGRRAFQLRHVVLAEKTADRSYKCLVKQDDDSAIHHTVKFTHSAEWIEHRSCTCGSEKFAVCSHIIAALYQVLRPHDVTNRPIQLFSRSAPTSQFATPSPRMATLPLTQLSDPHAFNRPIDKEEEKSNPHKQDNEDSFPLEAICLICLSPWEVPVTMPCGTHSVCQKCAEGLYDHCDNIVGNKRIIACPTCRSNAPTREVASKEEFVPNSDLRRLTDAYEKDKARWEQLVHQASSQKEDLKGSGLTPSSASSKDSLATLERKTEHCYEVLEKKYNNAEEIFQGVVAKKKQPGAGTFTK